MGTCIKIADTCLVLSTFFLWVFEAGVRCEQAPLFEDSQEGSVLV